MDSLEDLNRKYHRVMQGHDYIRQSAQFETHAKMLRERLCELYGALKLHNPQNSFLDTANVDILLTFYLADDYVDPDYNQDRKLSTGEIKDGNTGEIRDAPVHKSDLPKDLPTSNKGF